MKIVYRIESIPSSYVRTSEKEIQIIGKLRKKNSHSSFAGCVYTKKYLSTQRLRIILKTLAELSFSFGLALCSKEVREDFLAAFTGEKILWLKKIDSFGAIHNEKSKTENQIQALWAIHNEKSKNENQIQAFLKENSSNLYDPKSKWFYDSTLFFYFDILAKYYPNFKFPRSSFNWPFRITDLTCPLEDIKKLNNNFKYFAFPLYIKEDHFTLVFVDNEKESVEYYDSLNKYGNFQEIKKNLIEFASNLNSIFSNKSNFKFSYTLDKTLQNDGVQCGPWALFFLEMRLKDPSYDFNQLKDEETSELINLYRENILRRIASHRAYACPFF